METEIIIQQGKLIDIKQVNKHVFHLKIQSADFEKMDYVPGFTLNIFIGDPINEQHIDDRKYSIWNYEPVHQIINVIICTFSKGKGANWVRTLKKGDIIYFTPPRGKLLLDDNADYYLMIGDITALSHLYEINRNLPFNKKVFSFIYTYNQRDIFPDIDGSFAFYYYVINPLDTEMVKDKIMSLLPHFSGRGIAYLLGDPKTVIALQHHFKNEQHWPIKDLRAKPFWKEENKPTAI